MIHPGIGMVAAMAVMASTGQAHDLVIITAASPRGHLNHDTRSLLGSGTLHGSGEPAELVLRSPGPIHKVFLNDSLEASAATSDEYWKRLVVTGHGRVPKAVASDAQAIAAVRFSPYALADIDATGPQASIHVVEVTR